MFCPERMPRISRAQSMDVYPLKVICQDIRVIDADQYLTGFSIGDDITELAPAKVVIGADVVGLNNNKAKN